MVILLSQQLLKLQIPVMLPCVKNFLGRCLLFTFMTKINLKKRLSLLIPLRLMHLPAQCYAQDRLCGRTRDKETGK